MVLVKILIQIIFNLPGWKASVRPETVNLPRLYASKLPLLTMTIPTTINQTNQSVLPINPAASHTGISGMTVANKSNWANK